MKTTASKTVIFTVVIALVVVGLFYFGRSGTLPGTPPNNQGAVISSISLGDPAPTFTLEDIEGKTYLLESYLGQPVLIEFLAVWCPHCQNQAPVTAQITSENEDEGLVTLIINASPFGRYYTLGNQSPVTLNDLKWFRDQYQVKEPILIDQGEVGQKYGLRGFPMFILIDKSGKIVWSESGEVSASALQAEISKVL